MKYKFIFGSAALFATALVISACRKTFVEWKYYAGDAGSQKYSPLEQITAKNAKNLSVAWEWDSPDNAIVARLNQNHVTIWPHAYETSPLMVGGVLYASTSLSQVAAIDAATGTTLWVYDPKAYFGSDGQTVAFPPNIGFVERGVAYWTDQTEERLFFGTGNGRLIALSTAGVPISTFGANGQIDLRQGLGRPVPPPFYSVTSPPIVCGGTVIVGSSILDFPLTPQMPRGDVRGFDVHTGQLLWTFHTVPLSGELGAETWKDNSWVNTGGANVWAPMSCDEELGNVYLPVSTPANDYYGAQRKGDGLFGDSVVALNSKTGERAWHYQMVHHSVWDYDPPAAPNLVDITVGGRRIKALAQVTKQGLVFVLDRVTGKPIWPIEERAVPQSTIPGEETSPTQPIPAKPAAFDRQGITDDDLIDFTPALHAQAQSLVAQFEAGPLYTPPVLDDSANGGKKGTIYMPGNLGGASWTGAAFHPEKNILYVPSVTRPVAAIMSPFPSAGQTGNTVPLTLDNGLPITKPPYGRVTAIDLDTGKHVWMSPVGRGPVDDPALKDLKLPRLGWSRRSFVLATKGLLFVVQEGDIKPRAEQLGRTAVLFELQNTEAFLWTYDLESGKLLSETPIAAGNASGAPITYAVDGRQFVVIPVGGAGNPAKLVAFALPGSTQ
jgi:quinoprotein glucose dehydrogenase